MSGAWTDGQMHACMNGWKENTLQVVAALLLLQALAAGWAGNGAVLLQPRLKLLVMWFILQAVSMMSASILRRSAWVIPVLEAGLWRLGHRQRVGSLGTATCLQPTQSNSVQEAACPA